MTEITRVPLAPIASGSLRKLWLGVFVAVLGGGAIAVAAMPAQVKVTTITAGSGPSPTGDDFVIVDMVGQLDNGTVFQPQTRGPLQMGAVIPGFTTALSKMQVGGKYQVHIPAEKAYGAKAVGPVPANSDLNFTISLLEFKSAAEVRQMQMQMEQMRRQDDGRGPHGAGGPAGADGAGGAGAPGADAGQAQ